jgi:XTP/dITP diphosphohydrolase
MRTANILVLASTNRHKFEEMSLLFKRYPEITLVPVNEYIRNPDKIGTVETFDQYSDNAAAKARIANHACHYPCLADDSGIEIEALEGRPGVRSHRYAIAKKGETQDQANNTKLLTELKGNPNRNARFVCHLALVMEGTLVHVEGILEGTIAEAPRGPAGFGYDPLFIPKGYTQTLAEMGAEEKNKISHRAVAVAHLIEAIQKQEILLAKP